MTDNTNHYYTTARNAQIILYLLKHRGIRKVIASPGTQNMSLVVSMQRDPWFEMYSAADERSAAYIACGLAAESGEPVVLSCTGATASRNYVSGLTEAYYRHLPVIAITSTERVNKAGMNSAQFVDRSQIQKDIAKISVVANAVDTPDDAWNCMLQVNKALLEMNHHGVGPVHINLEKVDDTDFSCRELPPCRIIDRIMNTDTFPELPKGRIAIFVGSHAPFDKATTDLIDSFCAEHDAVVFCDHTSSYKGRYRMLAPLIGSQDWNDSAIFNVDVLIWLGEISGEYYEATKFGRHAKEVWRVNADGEIRDSYRKLRYIFEMQDREFFARYLLNNNEEHDGYLNQCKVEYQEIYSQFPELPFCNIWMARQMAPKVPDDSYLHFGILNSLRAWNFFEIPTSVQTSCNVGGFGIDGGMSALLGASLAHPDKLHFGVFGDLAFFYDMNSLGNRHVGHNLRIMLVNNAKGSEFKLYSHPASRLGTEADPFIAAAGHYGHQSPNLVRHYAEDLGFDYLTASTKEEFLQVVDRFLDPMQHTKPMVFEVFTSDDDESNALRAINSIKKSPENQRKDKIKKLIGVENAHALQRIVNKLRG
jgi:2-succinyl-5-enolpyruvyl-6-hydroxy-3-cyclohexene-1-carboxylate synthase